MSGIAQWSDIDPTGTYGPVAELTRVLALLESAEEQALTISELRAHGIGTPGQSVYELQLAGYPIERVHHRPEQAAAPCSRTAWAATGATTNHGRHRRMAKHARVLAHCGDVGSPRLAHVEHVKRFAILDRDLTHETEER